jgi:hypothetical protein
MGLTSCRRITIGSDANTRRRLGAMPCSVVTEDDDVLVSHPFDVEFVFDGDAGWHAPDATAAAAGR